MRTRTLRPHQALALEWSQGRPRIALHMQMRLGKTLVAIRWAEGLSPDSVLVACPLSVIPSWEKELSLEGIACQRLVGTTRQKTLTFMDTPEGVRWFVTNPEGLRAAPHFLLSCGWDVVIADESTFMRNPGTKVSKLFAKCNAPYRATLSGLPCPEGPEDLVQQFIFLHGEFMGCTNFWEWRCNNMLPSGFGWEVRPGRRRKIIDAAKELSFTLTADEAGMATPRVHETRVVSLPASVRRLYRQVVKDYRMDDIGTKWPLVAQTWLCQLASGIIPRVYGDCNYYSRHKLDELRYLLKGELSREQVVVFSRFSRELKMIEGILKVPTLTGASSYDARAKLFRAFQEGRERVIAVQEQKVGEKGIDLSVAGAIIFISNVWSWETRAQCEARADYISRKSPVLVLDLVAERTVDEAVAVTLKEKQLGSDELLRAIMRVVHHG